MTDQDIAVAGVIVKAQELMAAIEALPSEVAAYEALLVAVERVYSVIQYGCVEAAPPGYDVDQEHLDDIYWIGAIRDIAIMRREQRNPAHDAPPWRSLEDAHDQWAKENDR